jgi:DNA-binding transcriptional ArsR family regulator
MRELVAVMKALSDEHRLRALVALDGRELCLCQLVELFGLAPSTVSRHMSILQQARLVDSRKAGRWTYFRLAENSASAEAKGAMALVLESLARAPEIRDDGRRLTKILRINPEVLCRRQHEGRC